MLIKNLAVNLSDNRSLIEIVAQQLKISPEKIVDVKIIRKAIDARRYKGSEIKFIYNLEVVTNSECRMKNVELRERNNSAFCILNSTLKLSPIIIGFGPAGMFAALTLAKAGLAPKIFERGGDVDSRQIAVEKFFANGELDTNSNVQFGEGGAGTFSDGKLTTRLNDEMMSSIIETFIEAGAPEEIRYLQKPHIGTDNLRKVVKNIRQKIIALGGEIFFNSKITDIEISGGKIQAVIVNNDQRIVTDKVFFAIGHSARDTYEMLLNRGVEMESKAFAIGVRIEHPQEFIDRAQYGVDFQNPKLPVADYFLTFKDTVNQPGGQVVAATSENDRVVTNGMSNFKRDSKIANAAILSTVSTNDFADFGRDALCGVRFQRYYESLAFDLGGRNYFAPVQSVGDFLNGRSGSKNFLTTLTYPIGFKAVDLHNCLPKFVTSTLENALRSFNKKIPNFAADDVVMTGVETRTSSPCRILRNKENFQSINVEGLYPIGEGAGYSGGIMSSALDGKKAANSIIL